MNHGRSILDDIGHLRREPTNERPQWTDLQPGEIDPWTRRQIEGDTHVREHYTESTAYRQVISRIIGTTGVVGDDGRQWESKRMMLMTSATDMIKKVYDGDIGITEAEYQENVEKARREYWGETSEGRKE